MKYHYILSAFSGRAGCCKGEVNLGHYPWAYSWLGRQRSSLQISLPVKLMVFPSGSEAKESTCNARDPDSIPESGRSSGEGTGNPLQYSCLENPMDRGGWWATGHGVTKGRHYWTTNTFTSHEMPIAYITLGALKKKRSFSSTIRKKTRLPTLSEYILFEIL